MHGIGGTITPILKPYEEERMKKKGPTAGVCSLQLLKKRSLKSRFKEKKKSNNLRVV